MTTQTPAIPPTMNKSVRKTITVPKISVEKMDISTNAMIMLTFLPLTFFIGYVHTNLTNRMDRIENRMDRMESRMDVMQRDISEIKANQLLILNYIKNK